MANLRESLEILDKKIARLTEEKEKRNSISEERVQLVQELSDRARGDGVSICIKMKNEFFRITPKGFFWKRVDNGKEPFLLQEAVSFAKTENSFSLLLSAFLEGKAKIEVEIR